MKKAASMLVLCLLTFSIAAYGTTINTTHELKGYLENSMKSGVKQVSFSSKLSLKKVGSTLRQITDNGYEYAYVKNFSFFKTGAKVTVKFLSAYSQAQVRKMNTELDKELLRIVSSVVKPGMTPYQKELALHDYVVQVSRYDMRVYSGKAPDVSFTAYGALVKKTAVCEGYAKALSLLYKKVGIQSLYITGTGSGQPHAWNLVKLDGQYYHVDATFDDPVTPTGEQLLSHDFFNLTDAQMRATHSWSSQFPKASGMKYAYNYETEMADSGLIKSVDEMILVLEKAVLERQTEVKVKIFKYENDAYDLPTMIDAVMGKHEELDYAAFCTGYDLRTVGDVTTLDIVLEYEER